MHLQERPNVNVRIFVVLGTISLLLFIALAAAAPAKEKEPAGQKVDNGSFEDFLNGARLPLKTFPMSKRKIGVWPNSQLKPNPEPTPEPKPPKLNWTGNANRPGTKG